MRLGTCLPADSPAQVSTESSLGPALDALSRAGIRGCLCNFVPDESRWEKSSRALALALKARGIALLEYNAPLFLQPQDRSECQSIARSFVRLLSIAESVDCLNVAACTGGFGQGLGPHPWNRTPESWKLLKETCSLIANEAARRNLHARVEIELVYTSAIWSPVMLAQFVDEVGSPNVQGHMDIVNALHFDIVYDHSDFVRESFRVLGSRVHSAHIKDVAPTNSYLPGLEERLVGEGVMDFRTYLRCLASMPTGFPAIIEHVRALKDIERSYQKIKSIADEMGISVWDG